MLGDQNLHTGTTPDNVARRYRTNLARTGTMGRFSARNPDGNRLGNSLRD